MRESSINPDVTHGQNLGVLPSAPSQNLPSPLQISRPIALRFNCSPIRQALKLQVKAFNLPLLLRSTLTLSGRVSFN
nr:hypothetical protein Iba_chr15dCG3060 [Ipomoea batatas]GMD99318.1 hypothetical protein Iba_chr15eCG2680 [Ipomoea batatas]